MDLAYPQKWLIFSRNGQYWQRSILTNDKNNQSKDHFTFTVAEGINNGTDFKIYFNLNRDHERGERWEQ